MLGTGGAEVFEVEANQANSLMSKSDFRRSKIMLSRDGVDDS